MHKFINLLKTVAALPENEDEIAEDEEAKDALPELKNIGHSKNERRSIGNNVFKTGNQDEHSKIQNREPHRRLSVPALPSGTNLSRTFPGALTRKKSLPSNNRRHSMSATTKLNSFFALGKRIKGLVRVKNAFSIKRKVQPEKEEDIHEGEEFVKIHEENLPKEPRFSTCMSPEAIFAIMKGYEDTARNYLAKSHPEHAMLLKRNRTPTSFVRVKSGVKNLSVNDVQQDVLEHGNSVNETDQQKSMRKKKEFEKHKKRNALTETKYTLPPISRERQLELSYRLQNAMDIVDNVKGRLGLHTTSARRLRTKNLLNPVPCFNKWSDVWKEEFKIIQNVS